MTDSSVGDAVGTGGVRGDDAVPLWFVRSLWALLAVVVAFCWTALALLVLGQLRPVPFAFAVAVVGLVLVVSVNRGHAGWSSPPRQPLGWVVPVTALFLVGLLAVFNGANAAQHLRSNRDPGVYLVTGESIATSGQIRLPAGEGPFGGAPDLRFAGPGFYEGPGPGEVTPQFLHLFPAALAVGRWVAGTEGLLRTNALISALGLLFFFGFALQVLRRPWLALVGTAALGLNAAQVHFTRDTYSEPLAQLLLWGGLWAIAAARHRGGAGRWLIAGGAIGLTVATRVDAIVYLVPFGVVLAAWASRGDRRGETVRSPTPWMSVVGAAVSLALAAADALLFARPYLRDLAPEVLGVLVVLGLTALGALAAATGARRYVTGVVAWSQRHAVALAALPAIGLLAMWLVRPWLPPARWGSEVPPGGGLVAGIQRLEGVAVDPFRSYAEAALHRVQMTTGPAVMFLAALGIFLLARAALQGRAPWAWPVLGVVVAVTAIYVVRPSIVGDLPWFWRRYLPATIPGVILFAAVGAEWLADRSGPFHRPLVLALCAVGILARPVHSFGSAEHEPMFAPTADLIDNVCDSLGEDVAALLRPDGTLVAMPQTVQAFCGWPTALAPSDLTVDRFVELAEAWQVEGRRLVYLTNSPDPFGSGVVDGRIVTDVAVLASVPSLERTLGRPPERVIDVPFRLFFTRTLADATGAG